MHDRSGRRALGLAVVLLLLTTGATSCSGTFATDSTAVTAGGMGQNDVVFAQAFADRAGGLAVEGEGTVRRLLPDDLEGGRHQRFIVELSSDQTLLISHNIDVAPRVEGLQPGDRVTFKGDYEWNAEGGLVHWTHHDPDGRHAAGWIEHAGRIYR